MSRLGQFRIDGESKPARQPWTPPEIGAFADGVLVLAVDQSLSALGWVLMRRWEDRFLVIDKGSVRTKPEDYPQGHEGTLQRGVQVYYDFDRQVGAMEAYGVPVLVHETPPVGGRMSRPESSLVSATAIRLWAWHRKWPVTMVANQHSKKVLVNNANATKTEWHQALKRYWFDGTMPTNEGERDALCLALTYLYDRKIQED